MNANEQERIAKLLKQSLPPVGEGSGTTNGAQLGRDLWPAMLHRLQERSVGGPWFSRTWFDGAWFDGAWLDGAWFDWTWFDRVWFDCALVAAVTALLAFFPAAIPLLLYHL